jgi:hypothetical protein
MRDDLGCDIAAGAAAVLDNDRLLQSLANTLANQPSQRIGHATGCEGDNKGDLLSRILLRAALVSEILKNEQRQRHRD